MSWWRCDDGMAFHRKIIKAGNEAVGAWARMGAHSSDQLTDGRIDASTAMLIASRQAVLVRLVDAGLLEVIPDGYQIHDFLKYNPSAAQVLATRETKVSVGRRGGMRSGESRSKQTATNDEAESKHRASCLLQPDSNQRAAVLVEPNRTPVPSRPVPSQEKTVAAGAATLPGVEPKHQKPAKPPPVPLPWTIAAMLESLDAESNGRVIVAPFVAGLATPLTAVIRELAGGGCEWQDVPMVGQWIAAGGCDWMRDGVDLRWLATAGNLAGAIGKARRWDEEGRPSIDRNAKAESPVVRPDLQVLNRRAS